MKRQKKRTIWEKERREARKIMQMEEEESQ